MTREATAIQSKPNLGVVQKVSVGVDREGPLSALEVRDTALLMWWAWLNQWRVLKVDVASQRTMTGGCAAPTHVISCSLPMATQALHSPPAPLQPCLPPGHWGVTADHPPFHEAPDSRPSKLVQCDLCATRGMHTSAISFIGCCATVSLGNHRA